MTEFTKRLLEVAAKEVGTMEVPLGSNRGPRVDEYLRSVGLDPSKGSWPWCAAFTYWCFREAISDVLVPMPKDIPIPTAGVLDHWNRYRVSNIFTTYPQGPVPGSFFFIDEGHGLGHMGIVEAIETSIHLVTIEGNTNGDGSRNGVGVFRRKRNVKEINKGYILYE